jgi:hypothetical protein
MAQEKLKYVYFLPREISEGYNTFDRIEPLKPYKENPLMGPEKPWETMLAYPCVLYIEEENLYKMWYMTDADDKKPSAMDGTRIDDAQVNRRSCYICYAESKDGIRWERPALNIIHPEKYPGNNIVHKDAGFLGGIATVLLDRDDKNPARRYKMFVYDKDTVQGDGIRTLVSPDGKWWTQVGPFPVLPSQDTPSMAYDSEKKLFMGFLKDRLNGQRSRMISYSKDFERWSEPIISVSPDAGDAKTLNIYGQFNFFDEGREFSLLNMYDQATQRTHAELAAAFAGIPSRWPSRSPILAAGLDSWDCGGDYIGGGVPPLINGYRWVYYGGYNFRHDEFDENSSGAIGMAGFVPGRLAGQQIVNNGWFMSMPFLCPGGKLFLNAVTGTPDAPAGGLKVEVYGGSYLGVRKPYTAESCVPITGNGELAVSWKDADNLDALKGEYIRLKVAGKDSVVYGAAFRG